MLDKIDVKTKCSNCNHIELQTVEIILDEIDYILTCDKCCKDTNELI